MRFWSARLQPGVGVGHCVDDRTDLVDQRLGHVLELAGDVGAGVEGVTDEGHLAVAGGRRAGGAQRRLDLTDQLRQGGAAAA